MQRHKKSTDTHEMKNYPNMDTRNEEEDVTTCKFSAISDAKNSKPNVPTSDSSETTAKNDISQDFDLRKAIIYSEILKPKFDQE